MQVPAPTRLPAPPAELGRLGAALSWLARAQGAWPPHAPVQPRHLDLRVDAGLAAGIAEADQLVDSGADLLVVEVAPVTPAALAVLCVLLDTEPVALIGTAQAHGWAELVVAVRERLPAVRASLGDPEALSTASSIGHAVGLLAQSAVRRTPVLLGDSAGLAAAALVADRLAPGARQWWLAAGGSSDAGVRLAYAELQLEPLLDLGLRVPGAAAIALDVLVRGVDLAAR